MINGFFLINVKFIRIVTLLNKYIKIMKNIKKKKI